MRSTKGMIKFFLGLLAFALLILQIGCGGKDASKSDSINTGSSIGIPIDQRNQPPLEGPIISPSGNIIEPGMVTETGHTLPLDVLALRKKRERDSLAEQGEDEVIPSAPDWDSDSRDRFEEHQVSPDDGHTQNETTIDVDGQTLICGWNHYTNTTLLMGIARSTDGGHSWSDDVLTGHTATSDPR